MIGEGSREKGAKGEGWRWAELELSLLGKRGSIISLALDAEG